VLLIGCWADVLSRLIDWDDASVKTRLPLAADSSIDVSVTVFGVSDFIASDSVSQRTYVCGSVVQWLAHLE